MDTQRNAFIEDINRIKEAIKTTKSPYLKRDYTKALKRKYRELRQYDKFRELNGRRADIT